MARIKGAMMTRKRRNKTLKLAKGYWGSKSKHFKMAKQAVMKSGNYAYVGRKQKKREFRQLWITRISAACKMNGINYSQFMNGCKKAGITGHTSGMIQIASEDHHRADTERQSKKCLTHSTENYISNTGFYHLFKIRNQIKTDSSSSPF